jgi:hypothetical protein
MWSMLTAEILVTEPIEIEYRDGFFRVIDVYSDSFSIRRAIPPHIYLANLKRANQALAAWCAEQRRNAVAQFTPEQLQRLSSSG